MNRYEQYCVQHHIPVYVPPPLELEAALQYIACGDSLHTVATLLRIAKAIRPETTIQELRAEKTYMVWRNATDALKGYGVGVDREGPGEGMWMVHLGAFLCQKLHVNATRSWPMHRPMGEEYADVLSMHFTGKPLALRQPSARSKHQIDRWFL